MAIIDKLSSKAIIVGLGQLAAKAMSTMIAIKRLSSLYIPILILLFVANSNQLYAATGPKRSLEESAQIRLSNSENITVQKPLLRKAAPYIILVAAGGLLFPLDKSINREFYKSRYHSHVANQFSRVMDQYGMAGPYAIIVPLLGGHWLISKNKKSLYVAGELTGGILITGAITEVVKKVSGRKRPNQTSLPFQFFKGGSSFYSGHAIASWAFATIISKNYPEQDLSFIGLRKPVPLLPVLTYTAAGLVCIQRLYSHNHWASDVYYGALTGYGAGSLAVYLGNKKRFRHLTLGLSKPGALLLKYSFN